MASKLPDNGSLFEASLSNLFSSLFTLDSNPQPPRICNTTMHSDQMPINFPVQQPNSEPFSHLTPNQPPCQIKIITIDDHEAANNLISSSLPTLDRHSISRQLDQFMISSCLILGEPSYESDLLFAKREFVAKNICNQQFLDFPELGTKSDFSRRRCMMMFCKLPGFEKHDIEHVMEIFNDELYRQAFVNMKRSHQAFWLHGKIGEKGNKIRSENEKKEKKKNKKFLLMKRSRRAVWLRSKIGKGM